MKKLLIGLGVVVVLVLVAAVAIPFLVPVEAYKGRIVAAVKDATGRDLRIDGPIKLSVLPQLALEARDVALANAPGGSAKDMLRLQSLELRLKLWPLLHGAVEVDRFVLNRPVIALEIDNQGRRNWVFTKPGAAPGQKSSAETPPAQPAPAPAGKGGTALTDVRLEDVRIVDGTISYLDQRTGSKTALTGVTMTVSLPSLDGPLKAEGAAEWNGEHVALSLAAAKPRALEEGGASSVALKLDAKPIALAFKGEASDGGAKLVGDVDLGTPSVRGLAKWAGATLDLPGNGFGPLSIKGRLDMAGERIAFSDAALSLDAIRAKGALALDRGGARPYAKGRLDVELLDLNPYLPPEAPAAAAGAPPASAAPSAPAAPPAPGQKPPPAATAGWSEKPIDLAPLKLADADLDLSAGGIRYRKIAIGKSALALHLKGGKLVADLTQLALYQGSGRGQLTVDGSAAVPAVAADMKLAGIEAEPLLRDLGGFDRLTGKGDFNLAVAGHGKSQREIVATLDGKGGLAFTNGAVKGVNLGAIIRNPAAALVDQGGQMQQTDFSELGGTFTIANGILKNSDLAMKAPLFRLQGAGTVDLPNRTVDYRLDPKLAATAKGQGGAGDVGGLMVPVLVKGPWDHLRYEPDLTGIQVKGKLLDALKPEAGGSGSPLPSGKPADILRGLLGGGKR